MLFSVEQAFVGREEIRAPLKTPAWEAKLFLANLSLLVLLFRRSRCRYYRRRRCCFTSLLFINVFALEMKNNGFIQSE